MQLLPLLLPALLVLAVLAQDGSSPRPRGRGNRRGKTITDKTKKSMGRNLGLNMEERRARLEKFNKAPKLTAEQKAQLKERIAKHKKVDLQETEQTAPQDPAEVNSRAGVAPFFYESDINLTEEQLSAMEKTLNPDFTRSKRQATTYYKKWTGNTVNYYYDSSISARKINVTEQALAYISSRTCVKFVQSSTATNRIRVFNGDGCYSSIGMIGGEQQLSLGDGCEVIGTPAHEFTHALGFFHMQSRSDRDTYVTVDTSYVDPGSENNFRKVSDQENAIFTPFEYGSMMEYGANFMTNPSDKLSLVPKDMDFEFTMGNRMISHYDMQMINARYGCNQCDSASNRATCQNGGYPNPNNCAVCVCPLGYGGDLCDARPTGCGSSLSATTTAQSLTVTMGESGIITDTFDNCIYWITAPTGYYVNVKIISVSVNSQCQYGCGWNGIEVKGNQGLDQKMTHPRFCCAADVNENVISYLNPTPFIVYNRAFENTWEIEYSAVPISSASPAPVAITVPPTALPPVFRNCHDTNAACSTWPANNWCKDYSLRSWVEIKYNCAVTCGWCGYQLNPCTDRLTTCASYKAAGNCGLDDPMLAEYNCANTCGFCARAN